MVYDSFLTGRPASPFLGHGYHRCCVGFAPFSRGGAVFRTVRRHAQTCVQGALALQGMLRGGEETRCSASASTSSKNDATTSPRGFDRSAPTFITPFDRGDIKNLITAMDDAIDQMQQTAKAVILSRSAPSSADARDGDAAVECANLSAARCIVASDRRQCRMLTAITEELTSWKAASTISTTSG